MSQSNSRTGDIVRQVLVLLATIITVAFNSISQALPVGGRTSADVSNQYTTFFTPANYAFAIWGVIYLLLLSFSIYQALPSQRQNPQMRKISGLYILSCVLNCVWITLFQYDQILFSVIVIVAFLLTLIAIYMQLNTGRVQASRWDRWLLHLPFSVYLGWLCVATIANISVLGVAQNWGNLLGIAAPIWAAIMLVVATAVGLIFAVARRDVGFIMVFVWAFTAIISKQTATPVVTTTAAIMVVVLLIGLGAGLLFNHRPQRNLVPSRT
ncbi:MAG: tryptophan-rich sensory protein [Anaerolineae bacterium]|nr:tryptophan-rich sensory protein [Anaerolineae bacterium]